ncbi:hypothetical protein DSECCO2_580040 [anaerobic digester metagenome]|uniref:Uncharacterized protein n=3 Tax=Methanosarcina mazei TaxID=2209 RepID=Q8Q0P2_METMA|nr:hypothetical protein MM_0094 [Methanosarcina mazei Go1]
MARQLLNYHAALARKLEPEKRIFEGLGIRDSMMANNLEYIVSRERAGEKCWFLPTITISSEEKHSGNLELTCWHGGRWDLTSMRYSVHAMQLSALQSASRMQMASGNLEPGTLEAHLTAAPGPVRFIPTNNGRRLPIMATTDFPARSGSMNPTYFALTPRSLTDFDWLAVLDSTQYSRGGPTLK